MKFDIEIPTWAKWLAQDKDGKWYCYEGEPEKVFSTHQWGNISETRFDYVCAGQKPTNWQSQLYELYWE
jgi:hypothetical protein